MTPNEIIKAMDEFAALQAKATPGPWHACGQDRGGCVCGLIWGGDSQHVATATIGDWGDHIPSIRIMDGKPDAFIDIAVYGHVPKDDGNRNGHMIAASRSIPAAEAAALIREMRGMLRKMDKTIDEAYEACPICSGGNGDDFPHAPDCKLAAVIGSNQ